MIIYQGKYESPGSKLRKPIAILCDNNSQTRSYYCVAQNDFHGFPMNTEEEEDGRQNRDRGVFLSVQRKEGRLELSQNFWSVRVAIVIFS